MKTDQTLIELSRRYADLFCAVYIMTNVHGTVLYIGTTNNLPRRILEHQGNLNPRSFTAKYNTHKLIWFERHDNMVSAIMREKQLKAGSRVKKIALIEALNPTWMDLSEELLASSHCVEGIASSPFAREFTLSPSPTLRVNSANVLRTSRND